MWKWLGKNSIKWATADKWRPYGDVALLRTTSQFYINKIVYKICENGNIQLRNFLKKQLNDVEAGGNTVFLKPKVFIRPEKGSAAFWYNYFPNGDPNPDTLHAGCPVLQGNKWSKW